MMMMMKTNAVNDAAEVVVVVVVVVVVCAAMVQRSAAERNARSILCRGRKFAVIPCFYPCLPSTTNLSLIPQHAPPFFPFSVFFLFWGGLFIVPDLICKS
jgi:hypothetical protein